MSKSFITVSVFIGLVVGFSGGYMISANLLKESRTEWNKHISDGTSTFVLRGQIREINPHEMTILLEVPNFYADKSSLQLRVPYTNETIMALIETSEAGVTSTRKNLSIEEFENTASFSQAIVDFRRVNGPFTIQSIVLAKRSS